MKKPKFEIIKSPLDKQYYFRLRATNGEIILSGEGYGSKQSCLKVIAWIRANSTNDKRYSREKGKSIIGTISKMLEVYGHARSNFGFTIFD